jgi:hypothetical protein
MTAITRTEAITALNLTMATAAGLEGDTNSYFITSAPGEDLQDGRTAYRVGYTAEDPEESDFEGDETVFARTEDGTVVLDPCF